MFQLTILGCGSALPTTFRNPTAQYLRNENCNFLIDCGEGTQVALRKNKCSLQKLNAIFISHLHGDHCYGLPGLISSLSLLNREKPLTIIGPKGIGEFLYNTFSFSKTYLDFKLEFVELDIIDEKKKVFENKRIKVEAFKLNHRIPCFGYLFQEKTKPRKINIAALEEYDIPIAFRNRIKQGADFELKDGTTVSNHKITLDPIPPVNYAFCSDNRIKVGQLQFLKGVTAVYHEATFLHEDVSKAVKTMHSTAKEAAKLAEQLEFGKLLLGHYSARYVNPKPIEEEARLFFKNAFAVEDGQEFVIE